MAYGSLLYRRTSGVYVFRLAVPLSLRDWFTKNEIHTSTGHRTRAAALSVSLRWRIAWQQVMSEQVSIDQRAGATPWTALVGTGVVSLGDLAAALHLDVGTLALELAASGAGFHAYAQRWPAVHFDGPLESLWLEDGEIMFDEVADRGEPCHLSGLVQLAAPMDVAMSLKHGDKATEPYLVVHPVVGNCFVDRAARVTVLGEHIYVGKPDVTKWREATVCKRSPPDGTVNGAPIVQPGQARRPVNAAQTLSVTSAPAPDSTLAPAKQAPPGELALHLTSPAIAPSAATGRDSGGAPEERRVATLATQTPTTAAYPASAEHLGRFGAMRMSVLIDHFITAMTSTAQGRVPKWKPEEADRNRMKLKVFCDLTDNPSMFELQTMPESEALIEQFLARAVLMPTKGMLIRGRAAVGPTAPTLKLIEWADASGITDRMSLLTARNAYLAKVSECLRWGMKKGYLHANPCEAVLDQVTLDPIKFARKPRVPFSDEELHRIFSAEWFCNGGPGRNAAGQASATFRPYQYWLPLLALYAGGRVNELSQLYLDDLRTTADGLTYIDFTLDKPDKIDADDDDDAAALPNDKSLKTTSSKRQVPVHEELVRLGLLEYAEALRRQGHARLFPELRFNTTKGYGAAPRKWFNDQFLGKTLRIPRDGTRVFHSFRHNFTVSTRRTDLNLRARQQLLGHKRGGDSVTEQVYDHDDELHRLVGGLAQLDYSLPPIQAFNVEAGLAAVRYALRLKTSLRIAKGRPT